MTQYGHAGQHHGTGAPGCPVDLHHHHDERCEQTELADRRQRAREAFWDGHAEREPITMANVEAAIETATRVRVDGSVLGAALDAAGATRDEPSKYANAIGAAFLAAGFEVEQ